MRLEIFWVQRTLWANILTTRLDWLKLLSQSYSKQCYKAHSPPTRAYVFLGIPVSPKKYASEKFQDLQKDAKPKNAWMSFDVMFCSKTFQRSRWKKTHFFSEPPVPLEFTSPNGGRKHCRASGALGLMFRLFREGTKIRPSFGANE